MVCTTAFGMGVDVPSIEVVVRLGCPPTLEEMVQEFGQASRGGQPARGNYSLLYTTKIQGFEFHTIKCCNKCGTTREIHKNGTLTWYTFGHHM